MSQLRVFLSHSSQDKAAADEFARAFRQAGADVWYDEESLGAGHLRRTIMKELTERPIFVVLLSPVALTSSWVLDECEWAYDLQRETPSRVMLPVVVAPLESAELNVALYLRSLKRVEAGNLRPLPVADAATQALRLLGMTPAGQASAPSAPQPSESAADLVLRGKGLMAQKQYAAAVPLLERATQMEPENEDAWYNLGYVQDELEHWQESLAACERALTLNSGNGKAWSSKARALRRMGRNQEGLAAAEQAITLLPDYAPAWFNKGGALNGLQRPEEALAAYDQALALDPNLAVAWTGKAAALIGLSRYQEALEAAERALTLDPNYAPAWHNKGAALGNLQRYEESLAAYERANTLDPNLANAWTGKGMTLRALGRTAEAEAAERRAKELGG
ncbi:MAG: tetratricopeptide repeat protein [Ktedonobacterales bacterium]